MRVVMKDLEDGKAIFAYCKEAFDVLKAAL